MAAPIDRPRNRTGAGLVLAATVVIAIAALTSVLRARYDTGESYPNYSSLRADPLGTRALFESLGQMHGVETARQFDRLDKLQGAPHEALLLCGLDSRSFASLNVVDSKALARFAASGGRLIIAMNPSTDIGRIGRSYRDAEDELDKEDEKDAKAREEKQKKAESGGDKQKSKRTDNSPKEGEEKSEAKKIAESKPSLAVTLKIAAKSREFFFSGKEGAPLQTPPQAHLAAADTPSWHSNVFLDDDPNQDWEAGWELLSGDPKPGQAKDLGDGKPAAKKKKKALPAEPSPWHVVALKGGRNMIMERTLGAGSVVICTDRYFLSNEALWKGASTQFLSWLFGDSTRILFEETHLGPGVGDADGIMTLARRYGMQGLFLGGILLFALYIWRNAFSLVPATADDDLGHWRHDAVAGQSAASGLEGLLRRGIGPSKLLARCLEVWEGTRATASAVPADRRAKARALLETFKGSRQAPQAYTQIRDALHPDRSTPSSRPPPSATP